MKSLDEIMVSQAKLDLITGGAVKFKFPEVENPKTKKKRKEQVSIYYIIHHNEQRGDKHGTLNTVGRVQSFDDRFDKQHPVVLAIEKIRADGIRKSILTKIYADDNCIKMGRLTGNYSVFNDILNDRQRMDIELKLVKIFQYRQEEKKRTDKFFQ